ncbi:tyrosine kinase [Escherichia coli]|nr:tyrosine kinase [Escherichia coli]
MTEKVKQHAAPVTGSDEIDIGRLVGTVIEARWWVIGITAVSPSVPWFTPSLPRRYTAPTHWYKSNKAAAIRWCRISDRH